MNKTKRLRVEKSGQKPFLLNKYPQRNNSPKKTKESTISCSKCLEKTKQRSITSDSILCFKCSEETGQGSAALNPTFKNPKKSRRIPPVQNSLCCKSFKGKKQNFSDSSSALSSNRLGKIIRDSTSNYSDEKYLKGTKEDKAISLSTLSSNLREETKTDHHFTSDVKFLKDIQHESEFCSKVTENNEVRNSRTSKNFLSCAPKYKPKGNKIIKMDKTQNKLHDRKEGCISRENDTKSNSMQSRHLVVHSVSKSYDSRLPEVGNAIEPLLSNQCDNMDDQQLQPAVSSQKNTASFDFRDKLKYQDQESFASQRSHRVGEGLYNTDDLEDLPPRHKTRVLKVVDQIQAYRQKTEEDCQRMLEETKQKTAAIIACANIRTNSIKSDFQDNRNVIHDSQVDNTMMGCKSPRKVTEKVPFSKSKMPHKNRQVNNSNSSAKVSNYNKEMNRSIDRNGSRENQIKKLKTVFQPISTTKNVEINCTIETDNDDNSLPKNSHQRKDSESSYHSDKSFSNQKNYRDRDCGVSDRYNKSRDFNHSKLTNDSECSNKNKKSFSVDKQSISAKQLSEAEYHSRRRNCNRSGSDYPGKDNSNINDEDSIETFNEIENSKCDMKHKPVNKYSKKGREFCNSHFKNEHHKIERNYPLDDQSTFKLDSKHHLIKNTSYTVPESYKTNAEGHKNISYNTPVSNNHSVKNTQRNSNCIEKYEPSRYEKNAKDVAVFNSSNHIKLGHRNYDNSLTNKQTINEPKFDVQHYSDKKTTSSNSNYEKQYSRTQCQRNTKNFNDFNSSNHVRSESRNVEHSQIIKQPFSKFDDQDCSDRNAIYFSNSIYDKKHNTNKYKQNSKDFNSANDFRSNHSNINVSNIHTFSNIADESDYCSTSESRNANKKQNPLNHKQKDYVSLYSDDSVKNSSKQVNTVYSRQYKDSNEWKKKELNSINDPKHGQKHTQNSLIDMQSNPSNVKFDSDLISLGRRNSNHSSKSCLKTLSSDTSKFISQAVKLKSLENESIDIKDIKKVKNIGFFVHVTVSEDSSNLEMWQIFFRNLLEIDKFDVITCCKFSESLILSFQCKADSQRGYRILSSLKRRNKDIRKPHFVSFSRVKYHLLKPCTCELEIIENCKDYFNEFSKTYIRQHKTKISKLVDELRSIKSEQEDKFVKEYKLGLKEALYTLEDMGHVFSNYVEETMFKVEKIAAMSDLRKIKINFSRECNSFGRCLPIYSRKDVILDTVRYHQVSVIVAETGSGKSTQLAEYLLQSMFVDEGTVICTQPRKVAAISITQFVSGQIGSAVGKEIGYDVGVEKKYLPTTKIIYMTDYVLLRKCLRNRRLKGVSCVIIDEAHERTLYTDLLLGLLKQCFPSRPGLRVVITSATIDPSVFVDYFNLPSSAVVNVPGRAYPVKVNWLKEDVDDKFKYVEECVRTAVEIHLREPKGDILVFLTSPAEIDEAISLFKETCYKKDMPQLMSLHGKSDIQEQMLVFQTNSNRSRRIIFATNSAETSLTIPGIKYVIDSGMTKEMLFYPEKNKSCLIPKLINKSSAEQRKGRAGRTQPGVCFRLYSKKNYENMPERSLPEILKTNLLNALMKVYEFGIKPDEFDFVESPSKEAIVRSLDSLEMLDLVKDDKLTTLGQQVVQLSIEPRLAKFVLSGVECGIGHEAAIIAALVSEAGRLFIRFDDNKIAADEKKKVFCQESGDLCTFLEVYKRWLEVSKSERFHWCVANYISSKALTSASKTVREIIMSLQLDLGITISRRYNNLAFKKNFEQILFNSFSENLCVFSGHPNVGYFSPYFKESLFIHPSSSLKHLRKAFPKFLVYTTLMETSRNFILDVTPLKEETIQKAYLSGKFTLTIDTMIKMQIMPLVLGPFGEKMLYRHIIGKNGSVITNLEHLIERITKTRNFRLDIDRDKGRIIVYVESRFHEKISNFIHEVVDPALAMMAKEEKVIKMEEGFCYFYLSSGGIIHDIVMPGEFRKLTIQNIDKKQLEELKLLLVNIGTVQSMNCPSKSVKGKFSISAIYRTVAEAQQAFVTLNERKFNVRVEYETQKINRTRKPLYRLKLSWPRILCKGTGSIFFSSEEECISVCGKLTMTSICIKNKIITISPSNVHQKELVIKNLPPLIDEIELRNALDESLPSFLSDLIKEVHVDQVKNQPVVDSDILNIRDKLMNTFHRFAPPSKVLVDVNYPHPSQKIWEAWVCFEDEKDGKHALQQLEGNFKLNAVPVQLKEVLEAEVQCKRIVYELLKNKIGNLILGIGGKLIPDESHSKGENILIKFSCQSIENLCTMRQELSELIKDCKIDCTSNRRYFYLFTETGKTKLMEVQKVTNTHIQSSPENKAISIYGLKENRHKAVDKIKAFIANSKTSKTKVFDLKNPVMPSGFLKYLYVKYGMSLFNLVKKFNLLEATVDTVNGRLILKSENSMKEVEDHLENICVELYKKNPSKILQDNTESCSVCLDSIDLNFYRLEICGHAFCKQCLILQLKSKIFPILCAHENCGKEFLLLDIEKVLSFDNRIFEEEFHSAALQYHIKTNPGKVSHCPGTDCKYFYRVSSKSDSDFHCPGCNADICTHCQSCAHKGISCDMFQNSKIDEDYSLKVWMMANQSHRKQCPNCKAVIEKIDGCNHMECVNCNAHLCWLCLEVFPSGELVYSHFPYCLRNQQ